MIASMLRLNRADCKALGLRDAYSVHRIIYSLFPQQSEKDNRDFLFADKGGDWNCRKILILSKRKPEPLEFGHIESKEIPDAFLREERYGFEVVLNPTTRNGPTQKTSPVRGADNLKKWFLEKTAGFGFRVEPAESLQINNVGVIKFNKVKDGKEFTQTHNSVTFVGQLKVTDRQKFVESFKQGIGRAKGFGFGLLQIVPIK